MSENFINLKCKAHKAMEKGCAIINIQKANQEKHWQQKSQICKIWRKFLLVLNKQSFFSFPFPILDKHSSC
jgi:hypothetical protein